MKRFRQDFWNKLTHFQKAQVIGIPVCTIITAIDMVVIYVRH